jgi:hypothetical protein
MQVVVPQFIDAEDKIIGPITVRQFIELLIGGFIEIILYSTLDFITFVIVALIVLCIVVVITFAKINGQPFHLFALNFIQTLKNPKLKVWRKSNDVNDLKKINEQEGLIKPGISNLTRRPTSTSKISEIALIIDTGGIYQGEN